MALDGPKLPLGPPEPWMPRRRSMDGTGEERPPIKDAFSARTEGVGIAVVASPKRASISSSLIPAVSGYMKYTAGR